MRCWSSVLSSDIIGIDHLMLSVSDSEEAATVFSRMGFEITPRGQLPGMSNRLICFENHGQNVPNFVEMMSLDDPKTAPPSMAQALETPDRPVLMVAASADAQITHARLDRNGLGVAPVIEGGRDWTLPDGEVIDLAFSVVLPKVGSTPIYWIACEHKTPQHYLRETFTRHKNGSMLMGKIIAVAQDPSTAARHYHAHWGANLTEQNNGSVIASCGQVQLVIHTPDSFAASFPNIDIARDEDHIVGFAVTVRNIDLVQKTLRDNSFTPKALGDALVLDPSQCCGCLVIFEPR